MADIDDLEAELNATNNDEWDETSFQRRMDTVSDASSKLGTLLLQGWTMLADECDKCCTPMMSLSGGDPRCVVCNPVESSLPSQATQNNTIIISKRSRQSKPSSSADARPSRPALRDIDESAELKQLNELNDQLWQRNDDDDHDAFMRKRDEASDKLGHLLLKGWTMLAEHCEKCQTPKMSLRGGPSVCCLCTAAPETVPIKQPALKRKMPAKKKQTQIKPHNETKFRQRVPVSPPRYPTGMNGLNEEEEEEQQNEEKKNHDQSRYPPHMAPPHGQYPPPPYHGHYYYNAPPPAPLPFFGLGPRQDEQLRRTLGDIVKTVLDKMSAINQRMQQNDGNVQNDIQELNALMEFLKNVQQFKSKMRY
eukprot:CAMPEP_0197047426 /NCGR_PEP_ID=MMETSP1384-20130603/22938_1 /TAXON_ID=29189 /ORGANISM="Ammonia sp." /LENGTH=363 /DNA_ID=CAMNT_0042479345 /DNA_START=54 /DNA_END=1145 /DNA_ORIENTATION=+